MKVSLFCPFFAAALLATILPSVALAGPETMDFSRPETQQAPVVKFHKKFVEKVLIACGVVVPPPVYVAPGYLETTGPATMLVYRPAGAMRPRRVTHTSDSEEKSVPASTGNPAPSHDAIPAASPAPALAPVMPVPAPAPTDLEPGLLPETGTGNGASPNRTDEMLSYFQRQRPTNRPNNGLPAPNDNFTPNDPAGEPSFLQVPQAPEQPVLPPSRATYRVVP